MASLSLLLQNFEGAQVASLAQKRKSDEFKAGDTLCVHVRIKEGERERIQKFEGVCIARKNAGLNSAFTVRRVADGIGIERVFPLYSPKIAQIDRLREGRVRRAKLYYLRKLSGKKARIRDVSR